jgi:uncharacterized protein YkuJ
MKTKTILIFSFIMLFSSIIKAQNQNIYFEFNKSKLASEETQKLQEFCIQQEKPNFPKISLNGYSDTTGNVKDNLFLSQQRVEVVYNFLVSINYPKTKIEKHYYGESKPRSIQDQWKNRRVEIEVLYNNSPYSYFTDPVVEKEYFSVNNIKDTMIIAKHGTKVIIPARCFISSSGERTSNVIVSIEEYYSKDEMLVGGLTTTTDKSDFLISAGMINVKAKTEDGKDCVVDDGGSILIDFADEENNPDMQLFTGYQRENAIVWAAEPIAQPSPKGSIFIANIKQKKIKGQNWFVKNQFPYSIANSLLQDLTFPELIKSNNRCGEVILSFQIDTRGYLRNIKIEKGFHPLVERDIMLTLQSISKQLPFTTNPKKAKNYVFECSILYSIDGCKDKMFDVTRYRKKNKMYSAERNFEAIANTSNVASQSSSQWFSSTSLGYINCDRFYNAKSKTDLLVLADSDEIIDYRLVFNRINSIMTCRNSKNGYFFSDIPVGETVSLVAIKYEDEVFQLGVVEFKTKALMTIDSINMQTMNEFEIKAVLSELG